ncbi:MAG TPA: ABC transporter ATP-binding protein/permease [Burkholderiales bacterium]|nr:ABC transporter ATP-binding protein/permease [Burkholderiales bacterium]
MSEPSSPVPSGTFKTFRILLPYLADFKGRVALALIFLVTAKAANVWVPIVLKHIVDSLTPTFSLLSVPIMLLIAYGLLRLSSTLFAEMRDAIFAKVAQRSIRQVALKVFGHLHNLSLRFHLERQTGGVARDIERGTRGIDTLLRFMLFNILPTLVELGLVSTILFIHYNILFLLIILATIALYICFTLSFTEWRMRYRRTMNEAETRANQKSIDSLLNYETVKYFGNEEFEAKRYDENLQHWEKASIKSSTTLSALNAGQATIIGVGVTLLMYLAATGVVHHTMTVGDLVMVNAFMIQLAQPLNFLGYVYRELRHAVQDMERMFNLLNVDPDIKDMPNAQELHLVKGSVRFENVDFSYDTNRQILFNVSLEIPAGKIVAAVGHSGAGKSTLSRLLFRFYDVNNGYIAIDGQDIRSVSQRSLRKHIGVVPQDTVLFNDTIYYNILYGSPGASRNEVIAAAKAAHIHSFIQSLPNGYDTQVGERGLKLSGGEKQRVAIARTILKNPGILIFDEATSALDSASEKAIQAELKRVSKGRTTLIIAHRLSTIIDSYQILVFEKGRIIERGTHLQLLEIGGAYAQMWALQQNEHEENIHSSIAYS